MFQKQLNSFNSQLKKFSKFVIIKTQGYVELRASVEFLQKHKNPESLTHFR